MLPKILVIGGAGYIGSVLIEKLISKNLKVILFDKFVYNDINFFKKYPISSSTTYQRQVHFQITAV